MLKKNSIPTVAAALLLWGAPLAASAQDAQPPQGEQSELARFRAAVDDLRRTMLRPGARVPGWDRGGADLDAEVRAMGADRFFVSSPTPDGPQIGILTDRPIADFAPSSWRIVDSYGRAGETLENPALEFAMLSPRYVVGARGASVRRNDVDCGRGISHAQLFEIPGAQASPNDDIMPLLFRMTILATEDVEICTRSDGDRRSGYRVRYFLPDGTSLPELEDADARSTIIPAAPLDQLMRPR